MDIVEAFHFQNHNHSEFFMKIQITQTLANGQVTQQVLSKDSADVSAAQFLVI